MASEAPWQTNNSGNQLSGGQSWQICRLPNAELVPPSQFGELAPQRFADVNQHIIIYCHHGMRSQRAATWLRQHGFRQTQSMRGRIDAWSELVDTEVPRY